MEILKQKGQYNLRIAQRYKEIRQKIASEQNAKIHPEKNEQYALCSI